MPKWTAPNWITLKWTMYNKTTACITKLLCDTCALLSYNAAWSGNSALMFQDNLLVPASRVKKFKRENRIW